MDEGSPLIKTRGGKQGGKIGSLSFDESLLYNRDYRPYRIPDPNQPSGYRLAKPGEDEDQATGAPAEAYSMCTTYQCFEEFGVGVSLYFRQLIFLAVVFFVAGCIVTPAILQNGLHFPWHWVVDHSIVPRGTATLLWGSAVGAHRDELNFWTQGMIEVVMFVLLFLAAVVSNARERKAAYEIESVHQKAKGYAVVITNPLEEERDPDYYLPYLSPYGEVVMITMALDNGQLLKYLLKERQLKERYPTLNVSAFKGVKCTWWKKVLHAVTLGKWEDGEVLVCRWAEFTTKIDDMITNPQQFKVKRVYAVFNTERAQRACLAAMSPGLSKTLAAGVATPPTRILHAVRPAEPTEVMWENLHYRSWQRWLWNAASVAAGAVALLLTFLVLHKLTKTELKQLGKPPGERNNITMNLRLVFTSVVIISVNAVLPWIMRETSTLLEVPLTTSDMYESMIFKLVVSRCLNTAIFHYLLTPYAQTLRPRSLVVLATILVADCLAPIIAAVDPPRLFRQLILAPLESNPAVTDAYFKPQPWLLAERQTDMIKSVFLGLFYSAIMPQSLFITALAMIVLYWVDKTRLFYKWERPPAVDPPLAGATRDFLTVCLLGHLVMTRFFYANWPFNYEHEMVRCGLLYCAQKFWETPAQSAIVSILGVFVWIIIIVLVRHKSWGPIKSAWTFFTSKMVYLGEVSPTKYRNCQGIDAYVPMVRTDPFDPRSPTLLAADVESIPKDYLPFHSEMDPRTRSLLFSRYRNLDPSLFSVIKYYAARSTLAVEEEEDEEDFYASRECPSIPTVLGKIYWGAEEKKMSSPILPPGPRVPPAPSNKRQGGGAEAGAISRPTRSSYMDITNV